jgi:hypothetical protein
MNYRFLSLFIFFICLGTGLNAQSSPVIKDTVEIKDTVLSKGKKQLLAFKKVTTAQVVKFRKNFTKTWNKTFADFKDNDVMLMAGMNFAKQNISANDYTSPFIYAVEQKNVYKPGFIAGLRVDGKYKEKHPYAFAFTLNKYAAGANYKETKPVEPFLGGFSNFKAAEQSLSLNMTAMYRKLIPVSDTARYKFYVVAGPSLDIRLSGQGLDNQVNHNYRKMFLRAHLGIEFDNNSLYTIFFHYKQSLHSVTKSPIQTSMNNFDLGMLIKANDLF